MSMTRDEKTERVSEQLTARELLGTLTDELFDKVYAKSCELIGESDDEDTDGPDYCAKCDAPVYAGENVDTGLTDGLCEGCHDDEDEEEEEGEEGDESPVEFTESPGGDVAREKWARSYDDLNGAPEGDGDK